MQEQQNPNINLVGSFNKQTQIPRVFKKEKLVPNALIKENSNIT